ncbi:ATP-grasp fold amidoligase family protein [Oceanobacillus luteolus]|uniref:ATP-grasp fold amidoligase family protein n=1 Tax=Oceanobacillus luteolus TaxID=1274358 RepID=A0ABW4HUQ5_9BACI
MSENKEIEQNLEESDPLLENEAVLRRMMKVEAEIKRAEADIKASEKKIQQIKQSNTWKRTGKARKLFSRTRPPHKELTELEKEVISLQDEIHTLSDTLESLKLQQEQFNYNRIWRMVREMKDEGDIVDSLEKMISQKQIEDANYTHVIHSAARLFMKDKEAYRKLVYPKLFEGLKIEDIPEFMVRSGFSEDQIPLEQAASFRASLTMRMREHQLRGTLPEMVLDDKQTAYQFAKNLDVRTPEISVRTYTFDEIPEQSGIAIKPVDGAGARGVYLVYENDDIIDIKQSKEIANWQVLRKDMERDLIAGRVLQDEWFTEELILEDKNTKTPARDIKFYCFYGKVGLILEIVRYPELKYCWWTASGERVATGKYGESLFKGKGVSQDELELAKAISLEIPAPFIRIDFLRSDTGLVFGEFTPKPGNYDEFDTPTDKWLGDYFLDAQGRLTADLLNGKQFLHFKNLTSGGSID